MTYTEPRTIAAAALRTGDVIETATVGAITVLAIRRPAGDLIYVDSRLSDGTVDRDVPFGVEALLVVTSPVPSV